MEGQGYKDYLYSIRDKAQADGAFEVDVSGYRRYENHQVKLAVSDEPAAGTLKIQVKSPGASGFDLIASVDMTDPAQRIQRFTVNAVSIRFNTVGFDPDKTYSVFGYLYER